MSLSDGQAFEAEFGSVFPPKTDEQRFRDRVNDLRVSESANLVRLNMKFKCFRGVSRDAYVFLTESQGNDAAFIAGVLVFAERNGGSGRLVDWYIDNLRGD